MRPAPRFAYTQKFYDVFPYYLAIGMTPEQYWEGDCELVRYYRKAAQIRQDLKNQDAWLQGMYVYQAIGNLAPILRAFAKKGVKAIPYPDQPFALIPNRRTNGRRRSGRNRMKRRKPTSRHWPCRSTRNFRRKVVA